MKDFTKIILEHVSKYPIFRPTDAVKLIYQSEYGIGHLVADPQMFADRLMNEFHSCKKNSDQPMIEDIGSGICRLHFGPAKAAGMKAEDINRLFTAAAAGHRGSKEGQEQKLRLLEKLCREGCAGFSPEELAAFLEKYRAEGCPALHHSDGYRAAYQPHYRVIKL